MEHRAHSRGHIDNEVPDNQDDERVPKDMDLRAGPQIVRSEAKDSCSTDE
jgi:hypothetical protein